MIMIITSNNDSRRWKIIAISWRPYVYFIYYACSAARFWRNVSRTRPEKKLQIPPKGLNAVGGGAPRVVISGIQTSGGLLIRFARLFGRDDDAAAVPKEGRCRWYKTDFSAIRVIIFVIKKYNSNNDNSNKIQSPRTGFPREPESCGECTAGFLITTAANTFLVELRRGPAAEERARRRTWFILKIKYIYIHKRQFVWIPTECIHET